MEMDLTALDAPCGLLLFDDGGTISSSNPAFHRMLGYGPEESCSGNVSDFLTTAGRVFYQTHVFPTLKLEGKVEEVFLTFRSREGSEIPFLVNAVRIKKEATILNYAALFRISKRDRFEEELLEAKKEAERANQAKDDFLATLSHELRTPLTPVLLSAMMIESDPGLPEETRKQAVTIRRNVELEARLIDDLLDVTRISKGKMRLDQTSANVHEILGHAMELVQHGANAKLIDITASLQASSCFVAGDPARLQQVFWNILQNAIKFTPLGGRIAITTANATPGELTLVITDSGKGISKDQLKRIFEAFAQGSLQDQKQYGGLGLGLAISAGIVALHDGTIVAESEGTGKGAAFIIRLPAIPSPAKDASSAAATTPAHVGPLNLVLVEDHESSRETLALLLRRDGHQVTTFWNGEEALAFLVSHPVDLLICDLGLPGMSGLDLMRKLKDRHIRSIALSGYGSDEDMVGTAEAGFAAHLIKPVRSSDLRRMMERVLAAPSV